MRSLSLALPAMGTVRPRTPAWRRPLTVHGTVGYTSFSYPAVLPAKAGCLRRVQDPDVPEPRVLSAQRGRRIVICDYNQLLQSVTGLLRMSGFHVFQAYDGLAAEELCVQLDEIELLVLNTVGSGLDLATLVRKVRQTRPALPILHIGNSVPVGLPADVPTLSEAFDADSLMLAVNELLS